MTVYRTLKLLKRHGLVDELDLLHLRGDGHYYERRPQRDHLHITCLRCGKTMELESNLFDRLKDQVERECQFHILVTRLEIGGYCSHCRTVAPRKRVAHQCVPVHLRFGNAIDWSHLSIPCAGGNNSYSRWYYLDGGLNEQQS